MIRNTFSILQGIGEKTELKLWQTGIHTWDDFLAAKKINFISPGKKNLYDTTLRQVSRRLDEKDFRFFSGFLKSRDHWRLYPRLKDKAVALDIETNGFMPPSGGYVTVVGLYDGCDYTSLVKGENLTARRLQQELSRYTYLITFYGASFDMPFLQESLGVSFSGLHFDLCFGAKKAGLKGGLKKLEDMLQVPREESVQGLNGYDAVKLWREAKRGNSHARERLITYNRCDTVNLFSIADQLYDRLRRQTGVDIAHTYNL